MRILAIDPGTTESAYVIYNTMSVIADASPIVDKGKILNENIRDIIEISEYDCCAIEMVASYGMPVGKTTMETILWIGWFARCVNEVNKPFYLIYRKEIVTQLCGSSRAKDANVRTALIDVFGEPGTKKNPGPTFGITKDIWSALAIAHYAEDNFVNLQGRSNILNVSIVKGVGI